jgi:hypothetical protein
MVATSTGIFILGVTIGALFFAPAITPLATAGDGTAALAFFQNGRHHETP